MGRLESRLQDHPLVSNLSALRSAVTSLDGGVVEAANRHMDGVIGRVEPVLRFIEGTIRTLDPRLTTQQDLDAVNAPMSEAVGAVHALEQDPATYAAALDQHLDRALHAVAPLVAVSPLVLRRATAATRTVDAAFVAAVKDTRDDLGILEARLEAFETKRQEAEAAAALADQERADRQEEHLAALRTTVETQESTLADLVAKAEQRFRDTQAQQEDDLQELRSNLDQAAEALRLELAGERERMVAEGESMLDELRKLYTVVTDNSTTGAFHDEANAQRDAADQWRDKAVIYGWVAVGLAVLGVIVGVVGPDAWTSWPLMAPKLAMALGAAGLATYAGRQASGHRRREEEARRLEIELAAFPPFIESLEAGQQQEIRGEFSRRAFVGRLTAASEAPPMTLVEALVGAVRRATSEVSPPEG